MSLLHVGMVLELLGRITSIRGFAPGVYWVVTEEHGGYVFHESVARQVLSAAAIAQGFVDTEWICFEEDCAWALVAYEHPEWAIGPLDALVVQGIIRQEYPEYLS